MCKVHILNVNVAFCPGESFFSKSQTFSAISVVISVYLIYKLICKSLVWALQQENSLITLQNLTYGILA